MHPEFDETRTQDLPPAYKDAGQFYWGRTRAWLSGAKIHAPHSTAYLLPSDRACDIDEESDWSRAESLAMHRPPPSGDAPHQSA